MNNVFLRMIDLNEDLNDFFELIMNNTDYFSDYENLKPSHDEVKHEFLLDVPSNTLLNNKKVFGIYYQRDLIGFLDILFAYPDRSTCMIGYLVIDQNYRSQGIGQYVYNQAQSSLLEKKIEKVKLGVIKDNIPAVRMWEKQGFKVVDEIDTEYGLQLTMEKKL